MKRVQVVIIIFLGLFSGNVKATFSLDIDVVRLFVEKAVDGLDKPLKQFYEDREQEIVEIINDPTLFTSRLLFEVDRLEPFPFLDLPSDFELAKRKYGEDELKKAGDLPWRLIESYQQLVEAFRSSDFEAVLTRSAEIARFVSVMYMPVNLSINGDGEPTLQHGLRERFSSTLLEMYFRDLDVDKPKAMFLDRPDDYAMSICRKSYMWFDNILYFDYQSRMGVQSYDRFYYDGMWLHAKPILKKLLGGVALDTSSFWYTAWLSARRPDLPKRK